MCSDCDPTLITAESAPSMNAELEKISVARNEYRKAVRKVLADTTITSDQKCQLEKDLEEVVTKVNQHKFKVLERVNQLAPTSFPMSAYEQTIVELQRQQLSLQQQEIEAKKNEALAVAKPLRNSIIEKCTDLDMKLEQI